MRFPEDSKGETWHRAAWVVSLNLSPIRVEPKVEHGPKRCLEHRYGIEIVIAPLCFSRFSSP